MTLNVFVINLPHRTDKKECMLQQSKEFDIPLTFIEAVYGNALTDAQIKELAHDYPDCSLTKGVIGCALSHISVYKRMVDENIPLALVLEDDAIITENLKPVLEALSQRDSNEQPMTYLLSSHHYARGGSHGKIYPPPFH